ncbi:hypothetical protein [Psychrobacter celer]|uniref:hypothetical protein n=1 Tax=Psychrobacter celer TaxID=306572 RepID=UPI003FD55C82
MLVKINNRGSEGGASPINYLLGENLDRLGARVLLGNPYLTKELIDATDYAMRYTSGTLSFEEAPDCLTEEQKKEVMQKFESIIFCGLESDQYNILWVEHTDKDRLELNFLIPNQELRSGNRLQPFYHVADKRRVNAFQDIINHDYKLTDPHDTTKKRLHNPYHHRDWNKLSKPTDFNRKPLNKIDNKDELRDEIGNRLLEVMTADATYAKHFRVINTRASVVKWLEEEQGLTVTRAAYKSNTISVTSPAIKGNIRLKGAMYEYDFYTDVYRNGLEKGRNLDVSKDTKRYELAIEDLEEGIRIKKEYHADRFKTPAPAPALMTAELQQPRSIEKEVGQAATEVRRFRL